MYAGLVNTGDKKVAPRRQQKETPCSTSSDQGKSTLRFCWALPSATELLAQNPEAGSTVQDVRQGDTTAALNLAQRLLFRAQHSHWTREHLVAVENKNWVGKPREGEGQMPDKKEWSFEREIVGVHRVFHVLEDAQTTRGDAIVVEGSLLGILPKVLAVLVVEYARPVSAN